MKTTCFFIFTCIFLCLSFAHPVQAQAIMGGGGMFGAADEEDADDPALELPPLPEEQASNQPLKPAVLPNSNTVAYFPALPPSRLCKKADIVGLWKLGMVYESPTGLELNDFSASPFQYVLFNANDTFSMYKGSQAEASDAAVLRKLQVKKEGVLEQFVMHESGVLYFYKNGVSYDSLACFIVANKLDPFNPGQMLFMPPPDKATIRMVKVYQKVFSAPANTKPKKGKKKNRR